MLVFAFSMILGFFIAKKIKEGQGLEEIKLKNHLIICGWNFSTGQILSRLEQDKKRTGKAARNCTLAVIEKKGLLTILNKDPVIASIIYKNISAELCKRLIKSNKDILKLTTTFSLALEGD